MRRKQRSSGVLERGTGPAMATARGEGGDEGGGVRGSALSTRMARWVVCPPGRLTTAISQGKRSTNKQTQKNGFGNHDLIIKS